MPMFDDVLKIIEKFENNEYLLQLFKDARIFVIDDDILIESTSYQEIIEKTVSQNTYILPFPVVAFIFRGESMLLVSEHADSSGFTNGLPANRKIYDFVSVSYSHHSHPLFAYDDMGRSRDEYGDYYYDITTGTFYFSYSAPGKFGIKRGYLITASKNDVALSVPHNEITKVFNDFESKGIDILETSDRFITFVVSASVYVIDRIYNPSLFVMEKAPVKEHTGKYIARSHQRPEYTLLSPRKIRKEMRLPDRAKKSGKGKSPRPHDVRRYERWLSSKRYRFDSVSGLPLPLKVIPRGPRKGDLYYKRVVVDAHWSGPSENIVGNKVYRVMLDL